MMRPMNPEHPADAALLAYKAECHRVLAHHGLDQDDVADACLVDPSMVSRWLSKRCRDGLGVEHLDLLARRYPDAARDLSRWITGRLAPPQPQTLDAAALLALLAKAHEEHHQLARAIMDGLTPDAGGGTALSDSELAALEREFLDGARLAEDGLAAVRAELLRRAEARAVITGARAPRSVS